MVEVRVNRFDHIARLVTMAAFNTGNVEIVTISDAFIDLNYKVYMFHMIPSMANFIAQLRLRMGNLSSQKAHL